jgi:hypothetical protein
VPSRSRPGCEQLARARGRRLSIIDIWTELELARRSRCTRRDRWKCNDRTGGQATARTLAREVRRRDVYVRCAIGAAPSDPLARRRPLRTRNARLVACTPNGIGRSCGQRRIWRPGPALAILGVIAVISTASRPRTRVPSCTGDDDVQGRSTSSRRMSRTMRRRRDRVLMPALTCCGSASRAAVRRGSANDLDDSVTACRGSDSATHRFARRSLRDARLVLHATTDAVARSAITGVRHRSIALAIDNRSHDPERATRSPSSSKCAASARIRVGHKPATMPARRSRTASR